LADLFDFPIGVTVVPPFVTRCLVEAGANTIDLFSV